MITKEELDRLEKVVSDDYDDAREERDRAANILHNHNAVLELRGQTSDMMDEVLLYHQPRTDQDAQMLIMYYLGRIRATMECFTGEIRESTRQLKESMDAWEKEEGL